VLKLIVLYFILGFLLSNLPYDSSQPYLPLKAVYFYNQIPVLPNSPPVTSLISEIYISAAAQSLIDYSIR